MQSGTRIDSHGLWGINGIFKSNENIKFLSLILKSNKYLFGNDKWVPQIIEGVQSTFKIIKKYLH